MFRTFTCTCCPYDMLRYMSMTFVWSRVNNVKVCIMLCTYVMVCGHIVISY